MNKKRLFYLDFIRALATIFIITVHYNALYLYLPTPTPEKAFIGTYFFRVYLGDLGSTLFFIISGAALMCVYKEKCDLKAFYKKRFLSVFPMLWIAYMIDFPIRTYLNGGIDPTIPKWRFLLSAIGMDHYLSEIIPSFYCVGEWFLGCIILIYILFPLLRYLVIKHPVVAILMCGILYGAALIFKNGGVFPLGKNLFIHLPKFVLGMFYVNLDKKYNNIFVCIGAVAILIINTVFDIPLHSVVQATYVGVALFLVLVYLFKLIECRPINYISAKISKYSYAVFLVHHVIILRLASKVDLLNITRTDSYLLFFLCVLCSIFAAKGLYALHGSIMKSLKEMFQAQPNE